MIVATPTSIMTIEAVPVVESRIPGSWRGEIIR